MISLDDISFGPDGLIPAIAQDHTTNQVLMLAYMNRESLEKTMETGNAYYYSRSRRKLWMKGEQSGFVQKVLDIRIDCDADALLIIVEQTGGAACHTGHESCFYTSITNGEQINNLVFDPREVYRSNILLDLTCVIRDRKEKPKDGSYTNYLLYKGIDKMLKKVGEETAEVIIAAKNESAQELIYETADLLYHLSVVLVRAGLDWDNIYNELHQRFK